MANGQGLGQSAFGQRLGQSAFRAPPPTPTSRATPATGFGQGFNRPAVAPAQAPELPEPGPQARAMEIVRSLLRDLDEMQNSIRGQVNEAQLSGKDVQQIFGPQSGIRNQIERQIDTLREALTAANIDPRRADLARDLILGEIPPPQTQVTKTAPGEDIQLLTAGPGGARTAERIGGTAPLIGQLAAGAAPFSQTTGAVGQRNPPIPKTPPEIVRLQSARDEAVRRGNVGNAQELQRRIDKMGALSRTELTVPGEFGNVTLRQGQFPQTTERQPAAPQGGAGQPRFGKPLPDTAQRALNSAFVTFDNLDIMERNISESGLIDGPISKAQVFLGFNQEAIDFDTARKQLINQAQALIKGIPSNFDVENFIKTMPSLALPESTNLSRIGATRRVTTQLVADTIAFFKFSGSRIPDRIIEQAEARGINVRDIPAFTGGRADPLQNTIDLINQTTSETIGTQTGAVTADSIAQMSLAQLSALDLVKLPAELIEAVDLRFRQLGIK